MKRTLEAALFLSGRKLDLEELSSFTEAQSTEELKQALDELIRDYANRESSITISEEEGKYWMELKPEYLSKVKTSAPQMDMNRALLKTLSYIAYKQPVKQSNLVERFGNRIYEYVRELLRRGMIRAEPKGHTKLLTTTQKLTEYLGEEDSQKIKSKLEAAKLEKELKTEIKKEEKKELTLEDLKKKKELSVEEWAKVAKGDEEKLFHDQMDAFEKQIEKKAKKEGIAEEEFEP